MQKVKKAAFEGVLISKALSYIAKMIPQLPGILLKKLDWTIGYIVRIIYSAVSRVNPRQIMFIPFQGDYTCNPKYIAEELFKRNCGYEVVFSARKKSLQTKNAFPDGVRLVEQYSAEYYQEIAKSKIVVANSVEFLKKPTLKKTSQIVIETWHGSLGIKRFGKESNSGKSWVKAAKRCGKRADYIISNSTFESNVYRDTFWKNTPILQYGHPRNDILVQYSQERCQRIRETVLEKYPDALNHKLVLYAPTFRDSYTLDCYRINFDALSTALSERFGGEWSVLVRLHPTVRKLAKKYTAKKHIIDVTAYPDIQELMTISDIAITDYSSWIYDFMLTKKPGFIFATDMYSYVTERGFYYSLSATPFPIATNNKELMDNVANFDEDKYQQKLHLFLKEKGCVDDGYASQRTVDKIIELMG